MTTRAIDHDGTNGLILKKIPGHFQYQTKVNASDWHENKPFFYRQIVQVCDERLDAHDVL